MEELIPRRQQIIAAARSWLDTPFQHQGRLKGLAGDCAGLIICAGVEVGLLDPDFANRKAYGRQPVPSKTKQGLDYLFERVQKGHEKPGDIFWMIHGGSLPSHLSIFTGETIIHITPHIGRCVEHRLDDAWRSSIVGVYRYRGIDD